jgi:hypothetical protein
MFLWQHLIFIGFRLAFHLMMQILFCGCFCHDDEADEIAVPDGIDEQNWDPFCEYIISYKYEDYMTKFRALAER